MIAFLKNFFRYLRMSPEKKKAYQKLSKEIRDIRKELEIMRLKRKQKDEKLFALRYRRGSLFRR